MDEQRARVALAHHCYYVYQPVCLSAQSQTKQPNYMGSLILMTTKKSIHIQDRTIFQQHVKLSSSLSQVS